MRILLLSLYYPPLNIIAAQRIKAFEKYLTEADITVDVITRYYDEEQCKGKSMFLGQEKAIGFSLPYIRQGNILYTNFEKECPEYKLFKKLPPIIKGIYAYLKVDIFHYGWLHYVKSTFEKECKQNKYDFIITSYGPPIALLAAKQLSLKYNIPFLADFRDIYIDERDKSYHLLIKKIIQHILLKKAAGLVFATEGMQLFFQKSAAKKLTKKPQCLVYNGINNDTPASNSITFVKEDQIIVNHFFEIEKNHTILLHTGTIYDGQNIDIFINYVKKFNTLNSSKLALVFLGIASNNNQKIAPDSSLFFLEKVKATTSIYLQNKADALVLPIWENRYTGFSGKTLEYLKYGKVVLCSPNPQSDLLPFFEAAGNVIILSDFEKFQQELKTIEYKKQEQKNETKIKNINILNRSYWVQQLAVFLKKLK